MRPYRGQFNFRSNKNSNEVIRSGNFSQSIPQATHNIPPHEICCLSERHHSHENKTISRAPKSAYGDCDKSGCNKLCDICRKRGHYVSEFLSSNCKI